MVEIRDKESFEAWLQTLPWEEDEAEARRVAVMLAHRAAMRVLPEGWLLHRELPEYPRFNKTILPTFWSVLVSGCAAASKYHDLKEIASGAELAAGRLADGRAISAASSSSNLVSMDYPSGVVSACSATAEYACHALNGVALIANTFYLTIKEDVAAEAIGRNPLGMSLWIIDNPLKQRWENLRQELSDEWSFWIDWYDRALAGEPQDWELLTRIATEIPDVDWINPDTRVVNDQIKAWVEQKELAALGLELFSERQATVSTASAVQRGHNMPPELLDEVPSPVAKATEIVWVSVAAATEELEKKEPDTSKLAELARAILSAIKEIGLYCSSLGDDFLRSAAKKAGEAAGGWVAKAGIGALIAYQTAQNPKVVEFATRLLEFANKSGG